MKDQLLLISISNKRASLPMEFVIKTVIVSDAIKMPIEYPMFSYVIYEEGMTIPLIDLGVFFGRMPITDPEGMEAVIVDSGGIDSVFAILVDKISGIEEMNVSQIVQTDPLFYGKGLDKIGENILIISPIKLERLVMAQIEHKEV